MLLHGRITNPAPPPTSGNVAERETLFFLTDCIGRGRRQVSHLPGDES